jgi:phosphoglycolate phosphatase-like HAD superfamily hydrolase
VREVFDEFYWGAERYRRTFGRPPAHVSVSGYIRMERPLVSRDFFERLRRSGITKIGIATGRHEHEMPEPVEELGLAGIVPDEAIVTSDEVRKPDPRVLQRAVDALGSEAGLFVGDTKDDLEMVLRWRKNGANETTPFWAVMVAPEKKEQEFYKEAGADVLLETADVLPEIILELRASQHG